MKDLVERCEEGDRRDEAAWAAVVEDGAGGFAARAGYGGIRVVGSFAELVETPFAGEVNALCWARKLAGDFEEVAAALAAGGGAGIETVDGARLEALALSAAGAAAREVLREDLRRLEALGLEPNLDLVREGRRDTSGGPVATDVFSFHADSATGEADTYLCSYTVAASEGLRNGEALRKVDVPEIRAELLRRHGGEDDEGFRDYLEEHCYDLHYAARTGAAPYSFGLGHLWRIAIAYPGCPVAPCIHRAPATPPGGAPRLLLII